jgi:hypothetical protein
MFFVDTHVSYVLFEVALVLQEELVSLYISQVKLWHAFHMKSYIPKFLFTTPIVVKELCE